LDRLKREESGGNRQGQTKQLSTGLATGRPRLAMARNGTHRNMRAFPAESVVV
jgi:hypothetical protein